MSQVVNSSISIDSITYDVFTALNTEAQVLAQMLDEFELESSTVKTHGAANE